MERYTTPGLKMSKRMRGVFMTSGVYRPTMAATGLAHSAHVDALNEPEHGAVDDETRSTV